MNDKALWRNGFDPDKYHILVTENYGIEKVLKSIVPTLITSELELIEAKEEMKKQFKAEGLKINPFTEEFGQTEEP